MPSQLDLLTTKKFDSWFNHIIRIGFSVLVKVQLFWEGHKNLLSKCQNHKEDGANFCGFLRKAELYRQQNLNSSHLPLYFFDLRYTLSPVQGIVCHWVIPSRFVVFRHVFLIIQRLFYKVVLCVVCINTMFCHMQSIYII